MGFLEIMAPDRFYQIMNTLTIQILTYIRQIWAIQKPRRRIFVFLTLFFENSKAFFETLWSKFCLETCYKVITRLQVKPLFKSLFQFPTPRIMK